jgi:hypothetical protein
MFVVSYAFNDVRFHCSTTYQLFDSEQYDAVVDIISTDDSSSLPILVELCHNKEAMTRRRRRRRLAS